MPILYSCVIDAGAIVNESGDRDSVSKWHKVANVLIERIEPRSRKSYEHEGYVILLLPGLNRGVARQSTVWKCNECPPL